MQVLHVDLKTKESAVKTYPDLHGLVGGVGVASKLLLDHLDLDPVVFAGGPLNGYFPFASKACCAFINHGRFVDTYGGGRISTRLGFSGAHVILFENSSSDPVYVSIADKKATFFEQDVDPKTLGTPGRRSFVSASQDGLAIDNHFAFGEVAAGKKLVDKGVLGFTVSAGPDVELKDTDRYKELYNEILGKTLELAVEPSDLPSCSGCPMGCSKASMGETGGDVLVHSLVACTYAEPVYGNISTVFACLNTIGYDYTHEDLENLPGLINSNIARIYEKIANSKLETK